MVAEEQARNEEGMLTHTVISWYIIAVLLVYCCVQVKEEGRRSDDDEKQQFMVRLRTIEGQPREVRRVSEMGWDRRGWSGILWGGRYVGCPEVPDGSK